MGVDRNAILGTPDLAVVILMVLFGLAVGSCIAITVSRLLGVPSIAALAVLFWHHLFGVTRYFVDSPIVSDAYVYDRQAVTVAGQFGLELPFGFAFELTSGKEGYPYFVGLLYTFLGRAPIVPIVINCIVASVTAALILGTAKLISGEIQVRYVLIYMLVSPTIVTLGPIFFREALCWLGIAGIVYGVTLIVQRQVLIPGLLVALTSLSLLYAVRTSLALLCIVAAVGATAVCLVSKYLGRRVLIALGAISVVGFLAVGQVALRILGYSPETVLINRRYLMETATSGFTPFLPSLPALGLPGEILATIPNVVFGPFPWELGPAPVWLWIVMSAVFWWYALWVTVQRLRSGFAHQHVLWMTSFALLIVAALSVTLTNYGIAARIRTIPIIVLIAIMSMRVPGEAEQPADALEPELRESELKHIPSAY